MAIDNYKSFKNLFAKAIANNFEEGASREITFYPEKLKFELNCLRTSILMQRRFVCAQIPNVPCIYQYNASHQ